MSQHSESNSTAAAEQPNLGVTDEEHERVIRIVNSMDDQFGLVDLPPTRLNAPIHADSLIDGQGAEFSVDQEAMVRDSELVRGIFRDPEFIRQMNQVGADCSDEEDEGEGDGDGDGHGVSKFERKRQAMQDVFSEDPERRGLLYKRVRKFGSSGRPPAGALVTFHYSLYFEEGVNCYPDPFDSTRQHFEAKPYNKRLGGDLIPGIDLALSTMGKGERALFHIHPDIFLGEKGAMGRVPGGVPILADIELVNFCDSSSADAFFSKDEEERRLVPFRVQLAVVQELRHAANNLFNAKQWMRALQKYHSAESVLTTINISSDEEETRVDKELGVLCVNKAMTLYRLGRFPSVVRECNQALKLNPSNAKAMLYRGEALTSLGEFAESAVWLAKCQRLTASMTANSTARVNEAIMRNAEEQQKYEYNKRQLYSRMGSDFAPSATAAAAAAAAAPINNRDNDGEGEGDQLGAEFRRRLEEFAADPARRVLSIPKVNMTDAECRRLLAAVARVPGLRASEMPALIVINKDHPVYN